MVQCAVTAIERERHIIACHHLLDALRSNHQHRLGPPSNPRRQIHVANPRNVVGMKMCKQQATDQLIGRTVCQHYGVRARPRINDKHLVTGTHHNARLSPRRIRQRR